MEHDGNDVDAAFEALIAREFGEVVTAPGRPRPNGLPAQRAPAHVPQEHPVTPTRWMSRCPWNRQRLPVQRRRGDWF
ncbi:hypothetical protein JCM18918_1289 [Cutibacterium acnes JCM 18918]|nr:hypothetical protein JCM18918_1289 [Cutibacterium acnes JCM 18918]